jgi:hypothetical protein
MFEQSKSLNEMYQILGSLKTSVDIISNPTKNNASFPKGNIKIPTTKHGINTIFEFLKDTTSFK